MEEVDNIIFHFLRQLAVEIPEGIIKLSDLPVETIVRSAIRCFSSINPDLKIPKAFPPGISQRIEVSTQIATMCKELGYKGEVGYQTFLYFNEADLRKVFMFLIECLPNETEKASPAIPTDKISLLMHNIRNKVAEDMSSIWIPPRCKPARSIRISSDGDIISNLEEICGNTSISATSESSSAGSQNSSEKIEKILRKLKEKEHITKEVVDRSVLILDHSEPLHATADIIYSGIKQDDEDNVAENKQPEVTLQQLKEETIKLKQTLSKLDNEMSTLNVYREKIQKAINKEDEDMKELYGLLIFFNKFCCGKETSIDTAILNLKEETETLHISLQDWDRRIFSQKTKFENLKQDRSIQSERCRREAKIEYLKTTFNELREEYERKEHTRLKLRRDLEKLNTNVKKRSTYTKRIIEIIGNISKQKVEIDKVLVDTRQIQKEINNLSGQLDRSFTVADETVFSDAKKDDQSKRAYKLLATLHTECGNIVSLVKDTGDCSREIVDIEDHVEAERAKKVVDTLQRVRNDLKLLRDETNLLQQKL